MGEQWDINRRFDPDYKMIAGLVFKGWLRAITEPDWKSMAILAQMLFSKLAGSLVGLSLGLFLLVTSPLSFPLLCIAHKITRRRERLKYIKRNRDMDADI